MRVWAYRDDGWTGGKFRVGILIYRARLEFSWVIWGGETTESFLDHLYDSWRHFRCGFLHGNHVWEVNARRCENCGMGYRRLVALPEWAR